VPGGHGLGAGADARDEPERDPDIQSDRDGVADGHGHGHAEAERVGDMTMRSEDAQISLKALVKNGLRQAAQRLVLGEIRESEAQDMVRALTSAMREDAR
jgi:hypothetical protein